MWSVPRRFSDPSTAALTFAGLLSMTPGPPPAWETRPNFVAILTWSRRPLMASPTISSLRNGPVDLGGVDVGDAEVEGAVDGADRLRVVQGALAGVGAGHGHRAEADAGDLEGPEVCVLHGVVLRVEVASGELMALSKARIS